MAGVQEDRETTRNRESQRRSRQRRREYILDLEKRVRAYERDGARATVQMQKAALHVVEENRLLRGFLEQLGHDRASVDKMLDGKRAENQKAAATAPAAAAVDSSSAASSSVLSHSDAEPLRKASNDLEPLTTRQECRETELSAPKIINADTPSRQDEDSLLDSTTLTFPSAITSEASLRQRLRPIEGPGVSHGGALDPHEDKTSSADEQDVMGCVEAAKIIALMRGSGRAEDIWCELGCSATNHIVVKNSTIMSLAG